VLFFAFYTRFYMNNQLVPTAVVPSPQLLQTLFEEAVTFSPNAIFLSGVEVVKDQPPTIVNFSYKAIAVKVYKLANYLRQLGIAKGSRVAIVADNCPENVIAMLAALFADATIVPIYPFDLKAETIQYQLELSEVSLVLYENEGQKKRLGKLPSCVTTLIPFSDFATIFANPDLGANAPMPTGLDTDAFLHLYTSGSSGVPKGVVRDHSGMMANLKFFQASGIFKPNDRVLAVLPFPHIFPLAVLFMAMKERVTLVLTSTKPASRARKNPVDMRNAWMHGQCSTLVLVPRILEKVKEGIEKQITDNKLAKLAVASGLAAYRCHVTSLIERKLTEAPVGFVKATASDRALSLVSFPLAFVRRKIVDKALGKNVRQIASGGSALPYQIGEFFEAMGIQVLQGYGSTEAGITHAQLPSGVVSDLKRVPGNVGVALSPDIELQFHPDLGLLIDSPSVMRAYYKNETATAESFVELDGKRWYKTTDVAHLADKQGSLVIDGRADRLYKNDGGEKVQPEPIEDLLRGHPWIDNAVVYGANRPRSIAILSLDKVAVDAWIKDQTDAGRSILAAREILGDWTNKTVNPLLPRPSQVTALIIATEQFSTENELLTGNGKVRYKKVLERYSAEIDAMYG
jgi:long-chain acyl-CoA synthetase